MAATAMASSPLPEIRRRLLAGRVIPACPLALNRQRRFDERRQRALMRYYAAAGAGGVAVGVHTTQFAIRDPRVGLFRPLLEFTRETLDAIAHQVGDRMLRIGGICGRTRQALHEAALLRELGFDAGLVSLAAFRGQPWSRALEHCREIAAVIPVFGFYLQPAVGGIRLPHGFWRRFLEIENVVAIKIAPFNRYQTLDVVRASAESGREDVALYTGNDDSIVADLVTGFRFEVTGRFVGRRIVGGLLGQWAVGTRAAVRLLERCHRVTASRAAVPRALLQVGQQLTDLNAALFDAANGFAGCIAGIHEVLRHQGLLAGNWCLDPKERLSPGQAAEIERVCRAYPHLTDEAFVRQHRDEWLAD